MFLSGKTTVSFISDLMPLYTFDEIEGIHCARSLSDGTVILPMQCEEPGEEGEDEWVTIWWQGDKHRKSEVLAGLIASRLIAEFVQLQSIGKSASFPGRLLTHLASHYERKTGQHTFFYPDDENAIFKALEKAKSLGADAAIGYLTSFIPRL